MGNRGKSVFMVGKWRTFQPFEYLYLCGVSLCASVTVWSVTVQVSLCGVSLCASVTVWSVTVCKCHLVECHYVQVSLCGVSLCASVTV